MFSFHLLVHGEIDANMEIERMSPNVLQTNAILLRTIIDKFLCEQKY